MSFKRREENGVVFFISDMIPYPHAFSTRFGGVSDQPHLATLNLGNNRGDDPANVRENFRRICAAAGLPAAYVSAKQVHSTKVRYVDRAFPEHPELDGFVTDCAGVTLCVKTADCLPILLCDPEAGVAAALHAGWRGSAGNIAARGVEEMVLRGAEPARIRAAIGPGIGCCCFEVQDDFILEFTARVGAKTAEKHILRRDGRVYADLKGLNEQFLLEAGILPEHLDVSPLCTCCDPATFFSHRASGGRRGTMGALIALPGSV